MSQKAPERHREIIKAWADGKTIQYLYQDPEKWIDCSGMPTWNNVTSYRVKPEPPKEPDYGEMGKAAWLEACHNNNYGGDAYKVIALAGIAAYKKYQAELSVFNGQCLSQEN